jgi:hypothetical protein
MLLFLKLKVLLYTNEDRTNIKRSCCIILYLPVFFFNLLFVGSTLQPIITLAYSPDPDIHQQAAAALRGLAWSKKVTSFSDDDFVKINTCDHRDYDYFISD